MRARSSLGCWSIFLVCFLALKPALAQPTSASWVRDSARSAALAKLSFGTRVQVLTVELSFVEGPLLERSDTSLVIGAFGGQVAVPAARVRAVSVGRSGVKRGAITGCITGGIVFGLWAGGVVSSQCEATDCSSAFFEGFAIGMGYGGAVGAVIGLVIGSFTTVWRPHWP